MKDAQAPQRRTLLLVLLAVAVFALGAILIPFYGTLLWSVIVALLFTPLYRWLLPRLRQSRTGAALVTMLVVTLVVILPMALLTVALVREAVEVYEQVRATGSDAGTYFRDAVQALPSWAHGLLAWSGLEDLDGLTERFAAVFSRVGEVLAAAGLRLGQDTFQLVASVFIMLYVSFFLIRDGEGVVRALREAVPLSPQDQRELTDKFTTVVRATVKGNLIVAVVQGALGGVAFWILDVRGALLWGVLMGVLSLVPVVGAALVWLPVALYFLATGATWQGVTLLVYGALVIGLADNVLRPILVGKDTRLPDYVVLVTTLGGLTVFGVNGFVLGPLIAAMFIAVWHIAVVRYRAAPQAVPPP